MDMDVTRQIADLTARSTSDPDGIGETDDAPVVWGGVLGQTAPVAAVVVEG
ncbi:hypothetical protein [Nocardia sp. NPDC005745]|uniref:hypothetical protein n=1 Tax=Nocardia sp. NPDC005745 TaxID=3157061 RepID=UPI0033EA40CB